MKTGVIYGHTCLYALIHPNAQSERSTHETAVVTKLPYICSIPQQLIQGYEPMVGMPDTRPCSLDQEQLSSLKKLQLGHLHVSSLHPVQGCECKQINIM